VNTYKLTLIAVLSSLAVVGRIFFQFIPNVQPVSAIIILLGFYLGPLAGITIAAITTYVSNLVLGMGIWTIWQIIAWSLIGVLSGVLGIIKWRNPIYILVAFAIFSGYLYGFILSITNFAIAGKFLPYYLAGLPFDTNHAIGNGVFMIILYPVLARLFKQNNKIWNKQKIPAD
jgi:energy-coupling factor transport system substrate-specific component